MPKPLYCFEMFYLLIKINKAESMRSFWKIKATTEESRGGYIRPRDTLETAASSTLIPRQIIMYWIIFLSQNSSAILSSDPSTDLFQVLN